MQSDVRVLPGWIGSGLWRGWKAGVLLVLLCLSVYLPGFTSTPAIDRDESRFAQASRQMLESGDYIVPRVQGKPRLNKPPLIYWLQSASAWTFTAGDVTKDAIWMYRVPSLLAAIGVVLATWRLATTLHTPFTGVLAGAIIAVAPVFWWEARQARADMVLVLCTLIAVSVIVKALKQTHEANPQHHTTDHPTPLPRPSLSTSLRPFVAPSLRLSVPSALLLWTATAAGIMTKGPVTPLVLTLGILTLCLITRQWRWVLGLRPLLGLLIITAAVTPWVWSVVSAVGWDTWSTTVLDETLGRSLEPKEGHSGFPGYHTLLLPLLLFPGCVFVGLALVRPWWPAPPGRALFSSLLLTFILPTWLLMELIGTKLPHYTMPVYPLLAILTAAAIITTAAQFRQLMTYAIVRWAVAAWLLAVPALALIASAILAYSFLSRSPTTAIGCLILGLGLAALFCGLAAKSLRAADFPRTVLAAFLTFALSATMLGLAMPRLDHLWVSRTLARQLHHLDPTRQIPVVAVGSDPARSLVGFQEDSLIFESRGHIQRIPPADLETWFRANPHGFAILPGAMLVDQQKYIPLTSAAGFNYSKGRIVHLCIATVRPGTKP